MPEDQGADLSASTHTEPTGGSPENEAERAARKARSEAKQHREHAEELQRQLDELQGSSKSDLEKAIERANKADATAAKASVEAIRWQVAAEKGLPAALARRLQGATKAELEADADDLMAMAPPRRVPDAGNHTNGQGPQPSDANAYIREKLARRS